MAESRALLIGIGQRKEDYPALAVTATDALLLEKKLSNPAIVESYKNKTLTNSQASKAAILEELKNLAADSENENIDLALIYFSGHGCVDGDNYFLISHDTENTMIKETALDGAQFLSAIEKIKSNKLLLILDCCHSGGLALEHISIPFQKEKLLQNQNRAIITSSNSFQKSMSGNPASVFTYSIIEALHGKCISPDQGNRVSLFNLAMYVRERTKSLTKNNQIPEFNVLQGSLTSNFSVLTYENEIPDGRAFDSAYLLDNTGKEINTEGSIEKDEVYRAQFIWVEKMEVSNMQTTHMRVDNQHVENQTIIFQGPQKKDNDDIIRNEIIKHRTVPINISIEKEKVEYLWIKSKDNRLITESSEVIFTDAELHLSVSQFFMQWVKAVSQIDERTKTNFQILGKLLARFIDLDKQLLEHLDLYSILGTVKENKDEQKEDLKNISISVLLKVNEEEILLKNLPWEYLFIREKERKKFSGNLEDSNKKTPPFFLTADPQGQINFARQTNTLLQSFLIYENYSVLLFDTSMNTKTDSPVLSVFPPDAGKNSFKIFENTNGFPSNNFYNYFKDYILYLIQEKELTAQYFLHYKASLRTQNDQLQISIPSTSGEFCDVTYFLQTIEALSQHKPIFMLLDTNSLQGTNYHFSLAEELAKKNIPAVVGFKEDISEEIKTEFLTVMYASLLSGNNVSMAVTAARNACGKKFKNNNMFYQFGFPELYISSKFPVTYFRNQEIISETQINTTNKKTKYCKICKNNSYIPYEFPYFFTYCKKSHELLPIDESTLTTSTAADSQTSISEQQLQDSPDNIHHTNK